MTEPSKVWDVGNGGETFKYTIIPGADYFLVTKFSPDGKHIVSLERYTPITFWDVEDSRLKQTLTGHTNNMVVNSLSFSPDGNRLASGSDNETIKIWDMENGGIEIGLVIYTHYVCLVDFNHDVTTNIKNT